ncbi:hypothetical protein ZIOFF_033840 [Zingiber officinale]|uniref:Uncharacterized protein n=1 Tax=Zingiber officinale TaxID=94328 RepID=A0A8J5GIS5_ZINOF|nr:hypothetical protein ZIOFF_033840 [Zingiber officinale]
MVGASPRRSEIDLGDRSTTSSRDLRMEKTAPRWDVEGDREVNVWGKVGLYGDIWYSVLLRWDYMGNKIGRKRQVVDEQYTRPQGLYQHRGIDQKKLRKLILESKLAPCYPGCDEYALDLEECPICFWVLHERDMHRCPFCKTSNYAVEYHGMKTKEEKGMEEVEEQKVIEAKIRIQQQEIQDEGKRLKKRQDTSSSRRMISAEGEIQDEAKRLKKRQDSCSSSKTIDPTDDYCNIAVPSFKLSTQTSEIFPSQASCSVPAPSNSRNSSLVLICPIPFSGIRHKLD